jgi:four helix bundle protein
MAVKHFSELIAWQKAMDLVEIVYRVTEGFPQRELYGLASQLRRAAVSIPSNVAEGQGRATTKDFIHFLCIARGSLQEVQTQALIAERLCICSPGERQEVMELAVEVARIINGLIGSLGT